MAPAAGQRVDASTLVEALRTGAALQQGEVAHSAASPGDLVQLLSAAVDGSSQAGGAAAAGGALAGTALSALAPAAEAAPSLLSTTAAAQRATSSSPDTLLLLTTAGAALALVGTALESARRQRVRAAVARGRGRRALR